jgi:hypothetical protein
VRHVDPRSQDATDVETADDRQVQVEDDQVGRLFGHRRQRGISGGDDLGVGVATPFERVLDESGDVVLVFDDEDLVSGHGLGGRVPIGGIGNVSKMLIVG